MPVGFVRMLLYHAFLQVGVASCLGNEIAE